MTSAEVEDYSEKMGNFDEEAQPFEHRLTIDDDGITHNRYADEVHTMSDQDDEPMPKYTYNFINMNVLLPRGEGYKQATIRHSKCNSSGKTIVRRNANPFLDTRVYEGEFPYGEGIAILANTASTSLFGNCLDDGQNLMIFKSLLDHKSDMTGVQRDDGFLKHNGSNS